VKEKTKLRNDVAIRCKQRMEPEALGRSSPKPLTAAWNREGRDGVLQGRRGRWLRACPVAFLVILSVPMSHAATLSGCINRKVSFDGIVRLHYATVTATSGPRLYLHERLPGHCAPGNQSTCAARAYLIPGNAVAIGKECGAWDYVQYIGERRISEGWVTASSLAALPAPPAAMPPRDPYAHVPGLHPWPVHYRFTLTKGHGRPVCEAYLQRLNQSEFFRPPYCGRPESTIVPGFELLHRKYLTAPEILSLINRVFGFMGSQRQDLPNVVTIFNAAGKPIKAPAWRLQDITGAMDLQVWKYLPEVDIENDGIPEDLIVWHGLGASDWDGVCGALYANNPEGQYVGQGAFVLAPNGRRIDAARTKAVFGLPNGGYLGMINGKPAYDQGFAPIGYSIGIFQYRSAVYFDTFFNPDFGDFHGHRRNDKMLRHVLGVFEHKDRRTRQICEYRYYGAVSAEFLYPPGSRKSH
jgi:hypothetical protein